DLAMKRGTRQRRRRLRLHRDDHHAKRGVRVLVLDQVVRFLVARVDLDGRGAAADGAEVALLQIQALLALLGCHVRPPGWGAAAPGGRRNSGYLVVQAWTPRQSAGGGAAVNPWHRRCNTALGGSSSCGSSSVTAPAKSRAR